MTPVRLRPARLEDARRIRQIIYQVQINPMGLDWQRFILAVDEQDRLIGCGQVKPHRDGSLELASIAVLPDWRGQGIARQIIERLLADHQGTLFLTCRASLGSFYQKFGFRPLLFEEMPPYFKRLSRLAGVFGLLGPPHAGLLVMKRDGVSG